MALLTCCGCCSLQKGSIIVGILNFIGGVVIMIVVGISAARQVYLPNIESQLLYYREQAMAAGIISYIIILFILIALLIIGAIKRSVNYVLPFFCMDFGSIVISITVFISQITLLCIMPNISGVATILNFFLAGIGLGIKIYLWTVIYYFYQELITEKFQRVAPRAEINYPLPANQQTIYTN